jgi:hypothetical protein
MSEQKSPSPNFYLSPSEAVDLQQLLEDELTWKTMTVPRADRLRDISRRLGAIVAKATTNA